MTTPTAHGRPLPIELVTQATPTEGTTQAEVDFSQDEGPYAFVLSGPDSDPAKQLSVRNRHNVNVAFIGGYGTPHVHCTRCETGCEHIAALAAQGAPASYVEPGPRWSSERGEIL